MTSQTTSLDVAIRIALSTTIGLLDVAVSDETPFYARREYAGRARAELIRLRTEMDKLTRDCSPAGFEREWRRVGDDLRKATGQDEQQGGMG